VQGVLVGVEGRPLERTKAAAERGDLVDRLFHDVGGRGEVGPQVGGSTRLKLIQLSAHTTEARGVHAGHAEASLLVRHHVGAELEQRPATGDIESNVADVASLNVDGEVEGGGVDRQVVAIGRGVDAVHLGN